MPNGGQARKISKAQRSACHGCAPLFTGLQLHLCDPTLRSIAAATASHAFRTTPCQVCCSSSPKDSPEFLSIKLVRYCVQALSLESSSRISMSWTPSKFIPSPLQLSDQIMSRPGRELCASRNASSVRSKARAINEPGANFARSTAAIPCQGPSKPPSEESWTSSWRARRSALSPLRYANWYAMLQKLKAWKAASAFRKLFLTSGSAGASSSKQLSPRSQKLPQKPAPLMASHASSLPALQKPMTPTSRPRMPGRGSSNLTALGRGLGSPGASSAWRRSSLQPLSAAQVSKQLATTTPAAAPASTPSSTESAAGGGLEVTVMSVMMASLKLVPKPASSSCCLNTRVASIGSTFTRDW
mmetsp:Transcript_5199/g.14358  ORF Transcript_5199/g.14358 Transcript_5199/m.14358 type:complete len:357 (-) Transcript_5199:418-1488(-)